jgi:hypothetical protein
MKKSELAIRLKLLGADLDSAGFVSLAQLNKIICTASECSLSAIKAMNPDFKENFKSHLIKKGWTVDDFVQGKDKDYTPIKVIKKSENPEKEMQDYISAFKKAEAGYLAESIRRSLNHRDLFTDKNFGKLQLGVSAPGHKESTRRIWVVSSDESFKSMIAELNFEPAQGLKQGGTVILKVYGIGAITFDYKDFGSISTEFSVPEALYKKMMVQVGKGLKLALIKKSPKAPLD